MSEKKGGEKKESGTGYEGSLFHCGNPLLDISAEVEPALLEKYGVKLNDAIMASDKHLPLFNELISKYKVQYIAGGSAQNSIRVAQWMMQKPKATSYVGAIGKDKFGQQLRKCAEADGVTLHYYEDEKLPTGTCACLIHEKERSLIANLSAANAYKIDHMTSPAITSVYTKAKILYTTGFFLTHSANSALHLAKYAHENKKTFALNLSAVFVCEFFLQQVVDLLPYTDIVFSNESEAQAWAKAQKYEDNSAEAVAIALSKIPRAANKDNRGRIAIVTQGADSTLVAQNGKLTKVPVPKLAKESIVDVNGAGDAFVGGFLAYQILGHSILESVEAGHYAARRILGVSGTNLSGFEKPDFKPSASSSSSSTPSSTSSKVAKKKRKKKKKSANKKA